MKRRESIIVENDLPDPPERVWRALTDPSLLEAWLMPNNLRAEVGAHFQFRTAPAPGWSGIVDCEVLEVVPNRLLVYSWRGGSKATEGRGPGMDTVVTWRLTPLENGGTRLYLEHSGFDPDSPVFKAMGQGWRGKISGKIPQLLAAQSGSESLRERKEGHGKGDASMHAIDKIVTVTIAVSDQEQALAWFVGKLGFEKRKDMSGQGMRWLTVAPPEQKEVEFLLADWYPDLIGKNPTCVVATRNLQGAYEKLVASGVEFTQTPAKRPYGAEAVFRDLYGNKYAMVEVA